MGGCEALLLMFLVGLNFRFQPKFSLTFGKLVLGSRA